MTKFVCNILPKILNYLRMQQHNCLRRQNVLSFTTWVVIGFSHFPMTMTQLIEWQTSIAVSNVFANLVLTSCTRYWFKNWVPVLPDNKWKRSHMKWVSFIKAFVNKKRCTVKRRNIDKINQTFLVSVIWFKLI